MVSASPFILITNMKAITRFFWLCSGSSFNIIQRHPTEGSKYAGIGATIFFTGIFAALSASYAFYTVFDNYYIAVGSGLLWGAMIFNLDRYIVSSMRKRGSTGGELLMASPRIILAVLIALVICCCALKANDSFSSAMIL